MPEGQEKPPIKIKAKGAKRAPTPFETNLSQAREMAISRLSQATSLAEFLALSNATRKLTPQRLNWALDEDASYADRSASELLADFTSDKDKARFEEEAKRVKALLQEADLLSPTQKVQVVLLKSDGQFPDYRALAVFPPGAKTDYDLPRGINPKRDIIFMELNAPCNQQASEEVLNGTAVSKFELDNLSDEEIRQELGFDLSSQQNFRHRDSSGAVTGKRDEKLYLLFALKGGFSNETSRYLVSDAADTST